jgi:hypothetical protein
MSKISNPMPKITGINPTGEFQGRDGSTFYKFGVTLDDGQGGQVTAKSPTRWSMGEEVVVVSSGPDKFGNPTLKLSKPEAQQSREFRSDRGKIIDASWAVGQVSSLHGSEFFDVPTEQLVAEAKKFLALRDHIVAS